MATNAEIDLHIELERIYVISEVSNVTTCLGTVASIRNRDTRSNPPFPLAYLKTDTLPFANCLGLKRLIKREKNARYKIAGQNRTSYLPNLCLKSYRFTMLLDGFIGHPYF